jgi:hypothetical protein
MNILLVMNYIRNNYLYFITLTITLNN